MAFKVDSEFKYVPKAYRKKNTDCLWRISLSVYKDAKLWPLIYKANRNIIKDPDLIFPGQKLVIPSIKQAKKKIDIEKKNKEKDENSDDMNKSKKEKESEDKKSMENTIVSIIIPIFSFVHTLS